MQLVVFVFLSMVFTVQKAFKLMGPICLFLFLCFPLLRRQSLRHNFFYFYFLYAIEKPKKLSNSFIVMD